MNKLFVSLLIVLASVGVLAYSGRCHPSLLAQRQHLTPGTVDALDNSPPLVAFTTVALGGFRGLLADVLWLRAMRMQDEGNYFELVQLSDWITKLEPKFAAVWAYHAWNMAYNVSVLFTEPEDKWRWVMHGIDLLRSDGLRFNPGEAALYWELGWLYQHKIGQDLDQAHAYYKQQLAHSMSLYLPNGNADDLQHLISAAANREDLEALPGMAPWLQTQQEAGSDVWSPAFLEEVSRSPQRREHLVASPQGTRLLHHLRRVGMLTTLKMDPDVMLRLDTDFGPLDWRLPQAHGVYWSQQGLRHAENAFDRLRMERMTFQSMVDAFLRGRAFYDLQGNLTPVPNLDLLPNLLRTFDRVAEAQPDNITVQTARRTFLRKAVLTLHSYNHIAQAGEIYDRMVALYPDEAHPAGLNTYLVTVWLAQGDRLDPDQAMVLVESTLMEAYWSYALGDEERSKGLTLQAELVWQHFMKDLTGEGHAERVGLPPFPQLKQQALQRLISLQTDEMIRNRLQAMTES